MFEKKDGVVVVGSFSLAGMSGDRVIWCQLMNYLPMHTNYQKSSGRSRKKYWQQLRTLMILHILSFAFQNAATSLRSIGYLPADVLKFC